MGSCSCPFWMLFIACYSGRLRLKILFRQIIVLITCENLHVGLTAVIILTCADCKSSGRLQTAIICPDAAERRPGAGPSDPSRDRSRPVAAA